MSDIKGCFPSRFEEGVLLEADFSQLEVVGLAALSLDPMLIEDLLAGRDMHTYFTAQRLKIEESEVTPKQRKFTKRMTFQLQYGSGAKNMGKKLGLPQDECQVFIDTYYERYVRIKEWQEENIEAVERSAKPHDSLTEKGAPRRIGWLVSPLGRIYSFLEQDPAEWMKAGSPPSFQPTQIKNYPVQGSATGDIMALFRARVYRKLLRSPLRSAILLVNTVHDSIMADCKNREVALQFKTMLEETAAELVEEIMMLWGVMCPVPFKIETKIGPRWSELVKV